MKTVNMVPQTSLLMHKIQDKNLPLEQRMKTVDSVRVYLTSAGYNSQTFFNAKI